MVPLDGSSSSEQALPTALRLAGRDRAQVELVHVYEPRPPRAALEGAAPPDRARDAALRNDRASYLDAVAEWVRRSTGVIVTAKLLEGPVTATLAEYIASRRADLVVMTTHGRGGLSRLWLGGVASALVRESAAPVLLHRPNEGGSREQPAASFGRVLVPIDGSPESEEAIEHAAVVAGDVGVVYVVLHVVTPVLYLTESIPAAYPDEDELRVEEAYLGGLAERLRERGLSVETRLLRHPQPARAILEYAEDSRADLIVLETHVRSGIERLLLSSVTDKVVRASPVPVLVHRSRVGAAEGPPERDEPVEQPAGVSRS